MNPLVYLDIKISEENIGRVVIELFEDRAPKAANNFLHLCKGDISLPVTTSGDQDLKEERKLTFKNNKFHRVIKNFIIQAGDLVYGSEKENVSKELLGKGGCSIYANEFPNENSDESLLGHFEDENLGDLDEPMLLAMANIGEPNTNFSQFFIVTYPSPHLNGKHSIFGKVLHGKSVVRIVERTAVSPNDGVPIKDVLIADCGLWEESMGVPLYVACADTVGGDNFEEYPDDEKTIAEDDFNKAYEVTNTIKESGTLLFKKKEYQNASFKYQKALRYLNLYIPDYDVDKENYVKFCALKVKLYLNMCLCNFNLKKYDESIKYATFILDLDYKIDTVDKSKAYFRRAKCYLQKKRLDIALSDFKQSKEFNPDDKTTEKMIEQVEAMIEEEKEKRRKNLAKFFS